MKLVIDISKDRYDEIMSMDWKNCRLIFGEELRAIHDGKVLEQDEDAISRQAVLNWIRDNYRIWFINDDAFMQCVEGIKDIVPVNPAEKVGQWIPVSERLPELNRPLLVTAYHRVYYGHLISESGNYGYPVFRIHGLGDKNRDWVQETMSHEPYSLGRIDAWMYFDIPEPYKASPTGAERSGEE